MASTKMGVATVLADHAKTAPVVTHHNGTKMVRAGGIAIKSQKEKGNGTITCFYPQKEPRS